VLFIFVVVALHYIIFIISPILNFPCGRNYCRAKTSRIKNVE